MKNSRSKKRTLRMVVPKRASRVISRWQDKRKEREEARVTKKLFEEIDKFIETYGDEDMQRRWLKTKSDSYEELKHSDNSFDFWADKHKMVTKNRIEANIGPIQWPEELGGGGILTGVNTNLVFSRKLPFRLPVPISVKLAQKRKVRR